MAVRSGLGAVLLGIGLVGSIAGAAWWWLAPGRASFYTDDGSIRTTTAAAPLRDVMWRPPELLGGTLTTGGDEADPEIGRSGEAVYFSRPGPSGDADLFVAQRDGDGWGAPRALPINSLDHESGPALSRDGDWLYFASDRPGSIGGLDLWRVPIVQGLAEEHRYGDPEPLGPAVNTAQDELSPAFGVGGPSSSGVLYFSSNRASMAGAGAEDSVEAVDSADARSSPVAGRETGFDLYAWTPGTDESTERLDALSSAADDLSPAVSPAGDFVYFSSDRAGGVGGFDLYRARLREGGVDAPRALGLDVNSVADELEPSLAMEGFALLFASDRSPSDGAAQAGGQTDLYRAISREVYLARDPGRGIWAELLGLIPWLLAALALVLLLALLRRLVADVSWQGRLATLGLMARCVLLSMVVHAGVMVMLAMMQVKPEPGVQADRGGAVRVSLASSGMRAAVTDQLRGAPAPAEVAKASVGSVAAPSGAVQTPSPASASFTPRPTRRTADRVAISSSAADSRPTGAGTREFAEAPPVESESIEQSTDSIRTPATERAERVAEAALSSVTVADASASPSTGPTVGGAAPVETSTFEPGRSSASADALRIDVPVTDAANGSASGRATRGDRSTPALPDASTDGDLAGLALPGSPVAESVVAEESFAFSGGSPATAGASASMPMPGGLDSGAGNAQFSIESSGNGAAEAALAGAADLISDARTAGSASGFDGLDAPEFESLGEPSFMTPGGGATADASIGSAGDAGEGDAPLARADGLTDAVPSILGIGGMADTAPLDIAGSGGERPLDAIDLPGSGDPARPSSGADSALARVALPDFAAIAEPAFALPSPAPTPRLVGRVFDAETGEAIGGASVRLDLERADDVAVATDGAGRFELRFGDIPDNSALTASHPGYIPGALNIAEDDLDGGGLLEIALAPIDPNVISFEMEPEVHHLGNDEFSGRINSQFQRAAEGTRLSMPFEFPADRLGGGLVGAEIRLLTKGSQLENRVLLNGKRIGVLAESPNDGSFGEQSIRVPLELLRPGANAVEFRSVRRSDTDIDDFEFVNVRLVLLVRSQRVIY